MDKILIIEDDNDIANLVKDYLSIEGYEVIIANDGKVGVEEFKNNNVSLIILDIMLPGLDGVQVCRKVREVSEIPIIMLSAKDGDMDKILTLGVGADDYMTKPFSPMELVARVKAHLRRSKSFNGINENKNIKSYGKLVIDSKSYKVLLDRREISLTSKEFELLDYMSSNSNQVFNKEQLYEAVWGYNEFMDDNTIAVYIKRLRTKLRDEGEKHIKTVWGVGYKWE